MDDKELERLKEIEHQVWHMLDDSTHRVMEDEIVITRESFEKLCELLPEDHP